MRLALVFPPSLPPSSPPCGISYLKAFLGQGKNFDLNLAYYEMALDLLEKGRFNIEAEIGGKVLEPEQLRKAIDFMKGNQGNFYDPSEYNKNISIFFAYFGKINAYLLDECMNFFFEDHIHEETRDLLGRLLLPLIEFKPNIVGFSHFITTQLHFILAFAKILKEKKISIIVGGASSSQHPECYLSEFGIRKIDLSKFFDFSIYGEGEIPLKKFMEGEKIEDIPNAVYKNKEIVRNKASGLKNLDALVTPDFDDYPLEEYYAPEIILPICTSRGCYWMRCTFCIHYRSYYKYRTRSIERVISDLKILQKKHNASYFLLADEMVHPKRFEEISDGILKEGLKIRYYTEVKPTTEFSPLLLKKIYESGARALLWGVESGTQRILDLIDKGTKVDGIEKVLKNSHEAGIWNMIFIILGYPTQTEKEIEADITFMQKTSSFISTLGKGPFQLEVNSRIYHNPEGFGIRNVRRNPNPFSITCSYDVLQGLSSHEVRLFYGRNRKRYLEFNKISIYFGAMRDHMLLYADHMSKDPLK